MASRFDTIGADFFAGMAEKIGAMRMIVGSGAS